MLLFRVLAWGLTFLAGVVLVFDLISWAMNGSFQATDVGTLWFTLDANSLQLAEPAVARYLHPFIWHPVISTILLSPAIAILGVPALILFRFGRRRRSSIFRSG